MTACGGQGLEAPPATVANTPAFGLPAPDGGPADAGFRDDGGTTQQFAAFDAGPSGGFADAGSPSGFPTAAHRMMPQLVYGGSGMLKPLRLVTIVASNDDLSNDLFAFGDAVVAGHWFPTVVGEYGAGSVAQSLHLTGPKLSNTQTLGALSNYVQNLLATPGASSASPDGHTLYVLYLPTGVTAAESSSVVNTNCSLFAALHIQFDSTGDGLAIVQRCPPRSSVTGYTTLNQLTVSASHEIAEAAVDTGDGWQLPQSDNAPPWTQSVWAVSQAGGVENGDLCAESTYLDGRFLYQRSFSNAAAAMGGDPCLPARSTPYYNVSVTNDWYAVSAGSTITIPVTGWSTAQRADWGLLAVQENGEGPTLPFSLSGGRAVGTTTGGASVVAINNANTVNLVVKAPATAQSGTWMALGLISLPVTTAEAWKPGDDFLHRWEVGIYVP